MVAIPEPKQFTRDAIFEHHAQQRASEEPRGYLGASSIGRKCDRQLWYSFRWAYFLTKEDYKNEFDFGRMARLWGRGHKEEFTFCEELRAIGVKVDEFDENGEQYRFTD